MNDSGFPVEYKKKNRVTGDEAYGTFYVCAENNAFATLARCAVEYVVKNFISDEDLFSNVVSIYKGNKITVSNGDVYYILRFPDIQEDLPV